MCHGDKATMKWIRMQISVHRDSFISMTTFFRREHGTPRRLKYFKIFKVIFLSAEKREHTLWNLLVGWNTLFILGGYNYSRFISNMSLESREWEIIARINYDSCYIVQQSWEIWGRFLVSVRRFIAEKQLYYVSRKLFLSTERKLMNLSLKTQWV